MKLKFQFEFCLPSNPRWRCGECL